jgi:hypothetical protein
VLDVVPYPVFTDCIDIDIFPPLIYIFRQDLQD